MSTRAQRIDAARATRGMASRMCDALEAWRSASAVNASPAAMSLAQLAIASVERVRERALQIVVELNDGVDIKREDIVALHRRLTWLNSISVTVQQSTHPSLHPVLSPGVQSILRDLNIEGQVLVSGAETLEAYELSTLGKDIFAQLVDEKALSTVKTWPFLVFTIPRPPLDWTLHYSLLLHEIGHAVFDAHKTADEFEIVLPNHLVNPLGRLRQDTTGEEAKALFSLVQQGNNFVKISTNWAEELFADAFGTLLVGPAYVSAFCRVVGMSGQLSSATDTHPPPALRIHLMSQIVASREYLNLLPELATDAIRGWLEEAAHLHQQGAYRPRYSGDSSLTILLPYLVQEASRIYDELALCAAKLLAGRVHDVEAQSLDVQRAVRLARLSVPIVERDGPSIEHPGYPLDAARLLAGHWIAYYETMKSAKEENDSTVMAKYGDRFLGSLDAVEALRAWIAEGQ